MDLCVCVFVCVRVCTGVCVCVIVCVCCFLLDRWLIFGGFLLRLCHLFSMAQIAKPKVPHASSPFWGVEQMGPRGAGMLRPKHLNDEYIYIYIYMVHYVL